MKNAGFSDMYFRNSQRVWTSGSLKASSLLKSRTKLVIINKDPGTGPTQPVQCRHIQIPRLSKAFQTLHPILDHINIGQKPRQMTETQLPDNRISEAMVNNALAQDLLKNLQGEQVIPEVIPVSTSFTPEVFFSISWPSNGLEVSKSGVTVERKLTVEEPTIQIHQGSVIQAEASYTLVMTDPDAPSRADPKFGEWRHWVISGLKLTPGKSAKESKPAATPYYPPEPPAGSGFHRYVFLLFQEPAGGLTISANAIEHQAEVGHRAKWNAMAFAHKHNLKPVGANFFLTEIQKNHL